MTQSRQRPAALRAALLLIGDWQIREQIARV
jgi:hypothetical protein